MLDIRPVTEADADIIVTFIKELAEYEKLLHEVKIDQALVLEHLFGPKSTAEALIAHCDNLPAGFALFFHNFSTFLGRPGIYLEDLYVRPDFRGKGIGKALLTKLARLAADRKCGRLEWAVLNWNKPAIDFYDRLGAKPMDEWTVYRLTGEALQDLAGNE